MPFPRRSAVWGFLTHFGPLSQGCGITGFIPPSVIQGNLTLNLGEGYVFEKPLLLYHRSGHFPKHWTVGFCWARSGRPCFRDKLKGVLAWEHAEVKLGPRPGTYKSSVLEFLC